ncbi:MAG: quaternary ammonium compound-resistance protein SugE [Alphaproteobacteria bacterium]|nr:MAG: quaternary ammonium compound-resistance protein SugE [Caulobacteraceae bacterium]TPW01046.1 MAG: quaternary ammonium compound-resistance protein SugE [Alphaproteobacteria bacterium]
MHWIYLVIAGVLEVVWAYFMKQSAGFTKPLESAVTIVAMIASFTLLSLAMKALPLGSAYAIWTGVGAVGAFIVGVVFMGESANLMRVASAALILAGIIGLKVASPT